MNDRENKHQLVASYLSDKNLFRTQGNVTREQKKGVLDALMSMPYSTKTNYGS